nr:vegetative cell wall protein gp1-like [Aegilops tauschii subsp. strangulata]
MPLPTLGRVLARAPARGRALPRSGAVLVAPTTSCGRARSSARPRPPRLPPRRPASSARAPAVAAFGHRRPRAAPPPPCCSLPQPPPPSRPSPLALASPSPRIARARAYRATLATPAPSRTCPARLPAGPSHRRDQRIGAAPIWLGHGHSSSTRGRARRRQAVLATGLALQRSLRASARSWRPVARPAKALAQ